MLPDENIEREKRKREREREREREKEKQKQKEKEKERERERDACTWHDNTPDAAIRLSIVPSIFPILRSPFPEHAFPRNTRKGNGRQSASVICSVDRLPCVKIQVPPQGDADEPATVESTAAAVPSR